MRGTKQLLYGERRFRAGVNIMAIGIRGRAGGVAGCRKLENIGYRTNLWTILRAEPRRGWASVLLNGHRTAIATITLTAFHAATRPFASFPSHKSRNFVSIRNGGGTPGNPAVETGDSTARIRRFDLP